MGLLYIAGAFLFLIGVGIIWNAIRVRRLRREREGKDFGREQFIKTFRPLGIPDNVPAMVYDYYASQEAWKGFPFSPDDSYSKVMCADPEDTDNDVTMIADRLGMLIPPEYIRREYGNRPVETLRDMVLWLDWMRQHQPKSAPTGQ
jgi:hypothetical protein